MSNNGPSVGEEYPPATEREGFSTHGDLFEGLIDRKESLSPEEKEIREFPGVEKIVVKGSTALALKMGKDPAQLARDLDVFFIQSGYDDEPTVRSFADLDDAKAKLTPQEFQLIAKFAEQHGLSEHPIHVTRATEDFISQTRLFDNEPAVTLWDEWLEESSLVYQPVTPEDKERFEKSMIS